jgi:hypothetical protein
MNKTLRYISCLFFALTGFASCSDDDFLQRTPQTKLTAEGFFNTVSDLELYVNGFYDLDFGLTKRGIYFDAESDNYVHFYNSTELESLLTGNMTPANAGGWDGWGALRSINFFLANASKASGQETDINHLLGIARYFRAMFYFEKVLKYSDVPWYDKPLETDDEDLYKAADPRTVVVDNILADLQFAVDNVKADPGDKSAVSRYVALALMSRFCLFEGTFRKYHSELNLQGSADPFLNKAVWATEQLTASGLFGLDGNSGEAYYDLFQRTSGVLRNNRDVIQLYNASEALGLGHNAWVLIETPYVGLSNELMETYLMADGTPFTSQPDYDRKTIAEVFKDRDPRLSVTFTPPGWVRPMSGTEWHNFPSYGGYGQLKGYPEDLALLKGWDMCFNALPVYRYAEALLNLAEAKAELGTLTQGDIDQTVNKIRARVGMPPVSMAEANAAPDACLAAQYDKVSGANQGILLEIRRERRVETACEELRFKDVTRWAAGKLFSQKRRGMYVPALGPLDVSGDGKPDLAVLKRGNPEPEGIAQILYVGEGEGHYLDGPDGNSGHIMFSDDAINRKPFEEPKWYYRPIPLQQTQLNTNLRQVFGW